MWEDNNGKEKSVTPGHKALEMSHL